MRCLIIGTWLVTLGWVMVLPAADRPWNDRLKELRRERSRTSHRADQPVSSADELQKPKLDYIDELVHAGWKENGLRPAKRSTEEEFVRRSTLHLLGRVPTLAETQKYLKNRSADRRSEWIDQLLESDEFGANFANVWINLLIPQNIADARDSDRDALHAWLEREFNRNRPWDEMVREMISATGRWDQNPAVNFVLANQDANNSVRTTSMVTRLFLGLQTQCAECHDHKWNDKLKQETFHGINAFFVGTREQRATRAAGGQMVTDYWTLEDVPYQNLPTTMQGVNFERRNGLTIFQKPEYLDGRDLNTLMGVSDQTDDVRKYLAPARDQKPVFLRKQLADVITADDNPYFAKAIVNRLWFHLLGHSFTENVDDMDNGLDDPTMPELFDRLAGDFVASGHDLKQLVRWITNSECYNLSSRVPSSSPEDAIGFFNYQLVKPMTPEQLYDSILTLTQIDRSAREQNTSAERKQFINEFLQTFGNDELQTSTPTYEGTITQSLMLMNSRLMDRVCGCSPGSWLHQLVTDESINDRQRMESIYLAALSRKPTRNEERAVGQMLASSRDAGERILVFSDVLWAIVNSAEFMFNY